MAMSIRDQNAYLVTRKYLGSPCLRWVADIRFMAERQTRVVQAAGRAGLAVEKEQAVSEEGEPAGGAAHRHGRKRRTQGSFG